jgi:hypothetical protein
LEITKPKSKPLLFSNWYHPPDSNIELLTLFEKFLQNADNERKALIITGDFNCDPLSPVNNVHKSKLIDLLYEFQLQQLIKNPTRITATSKTLLDIIITKIDDTKSIDLGVIHLGVSDLSLVYVCWEISIPKENPKIVETRQFKHFNIINIAHFQNDSRETLI